MSGPLRARWLPFALMLMGCSLAPGADVIVVSVQNTTGLPAADLHLTFAGAGGVVAVDPATVVSPFGCPAPAIPSNPPAVTSTVVLDWGVACVAPGDWVSFIVATSNGPLSFAGGFWTGPGGVPIGGVTTLIINPGGGGGGPFWARKVLIRYRPLGPVFYTKWFRIPGQRCWWRWCCNPWGWKCEFRVILCKFATRWLRLWEIGVWRALTPWLGGGTLGGSYWWEHTTIDPPPDQRLKGPPPNVPPERPGLHHRWDYGLRCGYSDDDGQTFRPGVDFTSSFFDVFTKLQVSAPLDPNDPDGPPGPNDFASTTGFIAPGYFDAAGSFGQLKSEIDQVRIFEPHPLLDQMRADVELVQLSLVSIGNHLASGNPAIIVANPAPYQQLRDGLFGMGQRLVQGGNLLGSPQRYPHAAQSINDMASGVDTSFQMVLTGFPTPQEMDFYLWGLMHRFTPNARQAASGAMPHVRLNLDLGEHKWFPNTNAGPIVTVQNALTQEVTEEFRTSIADLSQIDIPIFDPNQPIRALIEVPGYLSRVVELGVPIDGQLVPAVALVQGDVNGDNCVDNTDLAAVLGAQGEGGLDAEFVPPTDVNHDGVVDPNDVPIVVANLGLCGDVLPTAECPGDVDDDGDIDLDDLLLVLGFFGSGGSGGDADGDGDTDLDDLLLVLGGFGAAC